MTEPQAYTIKPLVWAWDNTDHVYSCRPMDGFFPYLVYQMKASNGIFWVREWHLKWAHECWIFESENEAQTFAETHWQEKVREHLTPLPTAGREVVRIEGVLESVMHKGENLCTGNCILADWNAQCKADLHEQTESGSPAPGPRCSRHATPGITSVEVIVREKAQREVEP